MIFYWSLFILLLFFNLTKLKNKKNYYLLVSSIFFILSFIRWEVGTDWETYYKTFYTINIEGMIHVNEYMYKLLNQKIRELTNNYTVMLFIQAIIIYFFKTKMIFKYSKGLFLSLLINYCLFKGDIFFTRQAVAVAITFFSIHYIFKKEKIKFLLMILLAYCFHRSSVFFIFAYPLLNKIRVISRKKYILIALFGVFLSFLSEDIIYILSDILGKFKIIGGEILRYKILNYMIHGNNSLNYKIYLSKDLILLSSFLNRGFILIMIIIYYNKLDYYTKKFSFLYLVSFILAITISKHSISLGRILVYFEITLLLIIPNVYSTIKDKNNRTIFKLFLFVYLFLKLNSWISSYYELYVPFKSIINK